METGESFVFGLANGRLEKRSFELGKWPFGGMAV